MGLPRLLTVRSARQYGLTLRQLAGPRFRRLSRGVYLSGPAEPTLTERAAAALLALPGDTVITGVTALWLHGVEIGSATPIRVVTTTDGKTIRAGIRLSRVLRPPAARRRIATPVAAWIAACAELNLDHAVAAADWLIRLRKVTCDDLVAGAEVSNGRGCRMARRAAGLARAGAESPRESRLRLMLVLAGLVEPKCNPMIGDLTAPIGCFDLVLGEFMIIIGYDGDHHRTDPMQWSRDIARHEAAARAGYTVIRVTNGRMAHPRGIVSTVYAHLVERGHRGPAPSFGDEWRGLFEAPAAEW